jgi:hypothetical protein
MQRFLLHGIDVDLRWADSLLDDQFADLRVDAVVCDPPYGLTNPLASHDELKARWASLNAVRARSADFAWLEYAIEHLNDEGRAFVVLPASTLHRGGREGDIRSELVRRGAVESIVTLPPGTAPHTNIVLAVWIVRRPRSVADRPVLLIDGANGGSASRRGLDEQSAKNIVALIEQWSEAGTIGDKDRAHAVAVPVLELLGDQAILVPPRWLRPSGLGSPEERARTIEDSRERFTAAHRRIGRTKPDLPVLDLPASAEWVSVRELVDNQVAEIVRGVRFPPENCLDDGVRILRTRDIRETITDDKPCYLRLADASPQPQLTQPGDVILSPASGALRAVVDAQGGHALALPLQALRFHMDWLDPHVTAAFLESARNRRFAVGVTSGYARVDLRDLQLPDLSPSEAQQIRLVLDTLAEAGHAGAELARQAIEFRSTIVAFVGEPGD